MDAEEPEDLELDDELLSLSGDEDYDDEELQSLDSFYSGKRLVSQTHECVFVCCHISSPDNTQHACWSHNHWNWRWGCYPGCRRWHSRVLYTCAAGVVSICCGPVAAGQPNYVLKTPNSNQHQAELGPAFGVKLGPEYPPTPSQFPLVPSLSWLPFTSCRRDWETDRDARNGDPAASWGTASTWPHRHTPRNHSTIQPSNHPAIQPSCEPSTIPSHLATFLSSAIPNAFSVLFVSFCGDCYFFTTSFLCFLLFLPRTTSLPAAAFWTGCPLPPLSFIHSCTQLSLHLTSLLASCSGAKFARLLTCLSYPSSTL